MNSLERKVLEYIDAHREDIIDFLCDFIHFQSVNPGNSGEGEELEAQTWLHERMRSFGFHRIDLWAEDRAERRPNVVGTIGGKGKGRNLIYNGHCDVVPVNRNERSRWSIDPWSGLVKNGRVYGRGASDMKGGLTSMIWAAKALIDTGVSLKGNLYVESVVGEESMEGSSIGTKATVDRGYRAPFAIIAEPTNCEIHLKSAGIFYFQLIIEGKEAHTSARNQAIFPQRYGIPWGTEVGVDAIAKAVPFKGKWGKNAM